jgi:PHD/YefM family antitoxin component YafN of YafNO toxin-antitoxin module
VKHINLLDLTDTERELIRECEVQGTRSLFERNGRPVAILISYDEYLAMRETLDISNDPLLYARIETAEEETRQGRMLLVEDLLEEGD